MSFITTTLLTLGLASTLADAPAATTKPAREHGGMAGKLCEKLVCTASQKTQVQAIAKELHEDAKPDREAIQQIERKIGTELAKASPNEKTIDALANEIAKHQSEMAKRGLEAVLEVHALLDATQRASFAKLVAERGIRGLMGGHRGGHGKGGKPGKPGKTAGRATGKAAQ
jgi:Spy/CpxP family protein refolding chaperone